jgi:type II secretory pathway component PulF
MIEPEISLRLELLEKKQDRLLSMVIYVMLVVFVLISIACFLQYSVVPKYRQIFEQMLGSPDKLPGFSRLVLKISPVASIVSLLAAIAVSAWVWLRKKDVGMIQLLLVAVLVNGAQFVILRFALFLPWVKIISDISSP